MFMIWYCHKRGREVRLEREQSEGGIPPVSGEEDQVEGERPDGSAPAEPPSAPRAQSD